MGHVYTGDPDNGTTLLEAGVKATIPDDGVDARQAGSVNVPAGASLDMIAALYRRGLRSVKDLTQLANLTPAADTDVVFVPTFGLYFFAEGPALGGEDGLIQVRNTANTGTWVHDLGGIVRGEEGSFYGASNGFAYMRGGKLPVRAVLNATVVEYFTPPLTPAFTTTSGSFVNAHVTDPISVESGDRVRVEVIGHLFTDDVAHLAKAQLVLTGTPVPGTPFQPLACVANSDDSGYTTNGHHPTHFAYEFIATGTGTFTASVQILESGSTGQHATWDAGAQIFVRVVRP